MEKKVKSKKSKKEKQKRSLDPKKIRDSMGTLRKGKISPFPWPTGWPTNSDYSQTTIKAIVLSFFHRKIGGSIFCSYPKNVLDQTALAKISDIMEKEEGGLPFFRNLFENLTSLNHYFEIHSDWARGNKEMLLISIIFDQPLETMVDAYEKLSSFCEDFSEQLKLNKDVYTAFYISDIDKFNEDDKEKIVNNESLIKKSIKKLYWQFINELGLKKEISIDWENESSEPAYDEDNKYVNTSPTIPPMSPGGAASAKRKIPVVVQKIKTESEPYCRHCGAKLPKGQTLCHACGKKVG